MRLLPKVDVGDVEAEQALEALDGARAHRTADRFGHGDPKQASDRIRKKRSFGEGCLRVRAAVHERKNERREEARVVAAKGSSEIAHAHAHVCARATRGGPHRFRAKDSGGELREALDDPEVRVQEKVLPHEELLLETVQEGRGELVVRIELLHDDHDAESRVDRAELRVAPKGKAHVALARVVGVVLVEEVVQGLVERLAVDEHDVHTFRHAQLDPLDVEADLKVRLIKSKFGPKDHLRLAMRQDLEVEEHVQRRVILRQDLQ